jgi:uncharacterized protein YbaR (Trm112 family)
LPIDPKLMEILACPKCKSPLREESSGDTVELVCTSSACGLAYPVRDGIPVLLIDEARQPGPSAEPSGGA